MSEHGKRPATGGTFTEGYDLGQEDATTGHPRRIPKLRHPSRGDPYRKGYDGGYEDGLIAAPQVTDTQAEDAADDAAATEATAGKWK